MISIQQRFLAQVLLDTEKYVLQNPRYGNTAESFNVSTYLLSEAFRSLMCFSAMYPSYGVVTDQSPEVAKVVADLCSEDLDDDKQQELQDQGNLLERALQDPAARLVILGVLEAYKALEHERSEEVPQDPDGNA